MVSLKLSMNSDIAGVDFLFGMEDRNLNLIIQANFKGMNVIVQIVKFSALICILEEQTEGHFIFSLSSHFLV
jgi:hypothetical protein